MIIDAAVAVISIVTFGVAAWIALTSIQRGVPPKSPGYDGAIPTRENNPVAFWAYVVFAAAVALIALFVLAQTVRVYF